MALGGSGRRLSRGRPDAAVNGLPKREHRCLTPLRGAATKRSESGSTPVASRAARSAAGCSPDPLSGHSRTLAEASRLARLAPAAVLLGLERLLGDARPVRARLLRDPTPLLRREAPPDVPQRQRGPNRTEATAETEARHTPIVHARVTSCARWQRVRQSSAASVTPRRPPPARWQAPRRSAGRERVARAGRAG